MCRKKIAIYVEGHSEQILLNCLIKLWWQHSGIEITNLKIHGGNTTQREKKDIEDYSSGDSENSIRFLIINVDGEGSLSSSIAARANRLQAEQYEIIGLRDLHAQDFTDMALSDKNEAARRITATIQEALKIKKCNNPERISIFFAIMEIEAWLLAFKNASSSWSKGSDLTIPHDLEAVKRPSTLMSKLGKNSDRENHKTSHHMKSFVSGITREEIQEVYSSKRIPSFSVFWGQVLNLTDSNDKIT
jgi:hypothetical protein